MESHLCSRHAGWCSTAICPSCRCSSQNTIDIVCSSCASWCSIDIFTSCSRFWNCCSCPAQASVASCTLLYVCYPTRTTIDVPITRWKGGTQCARLSRCSAVFDGYVDIEKELEERAAAAAAAAGCCFWNIINKGDLKLETWNDDVELEDDEPGVFAGDPWPSCSFRNWTPLCQKGAVLINYTNQKCKQFCSDILLE